MNMKITGLIALLLLGGPLGCDQPRTEPRRESISLQASRLIDEKRSEEAIQLLEPHVRANPEDIDAAVSLAGAYAHRAGFQFRKFFGMIDQILVFAKTLRDSPDALASIEGKNLSNTEKTISLWSHHSSRIFGMVRIFEAIPRVEKDQVDYIRHAIQILNSKESRLRPVDRSFRILLRAVVVKHLLSQIAEPSETSPNAAEPGSRKICYIDFRAVDRYLNTPGAELISIFADMAWVQPKGRQGFERSVRDVKNSITNLNVMLTSLSLANDAALLYLKNSVVNGDTTTEQSILPNLGRLIACSN